MPPDTNWVQYQIEFADRATAEHTAAHRLLPRLIEAQDNDDLSMWWYIRKTPAWRLRFQPHRHGVTVVDSLLAELVTSRDVRNRTHGIYEPETVAFGGGEAMDSAHLLFHHDSQHLLDRAAQNTAAPTLGRSETTVLLFSTMARAAGLDWFEQGDIWAKIAGLRPVAQGHSLGPERAQRLGQAIRRLMTVDPFSVPRLLPEPWSAAFTTAGQELAALARHGRLERGLRAVLAHHFIFHANRAGLSAADQATLAALAVNTVFHLSKRPVYAGISITNSKVPPMTTTLSDASADELRNRLTDQLRTDGKIATPAVENAFRHVPRHLFVPGVPLQEAYANEAVYTKHDGSGASISAASQPSIVAMMLEQLQIEPGQRLLELGAGTGYNAALMATITGEAGHVTTIDVDDDLVDDARKHLATAGITGVDVVLTDGALGHPESSPFHRVIATVGAYEVPRAWLDQLTRGGQMVVPVRLTGAASRSISFERGTDAWISRDSQMAVFMPLRGIGDDARRIIDLTGDGTVTLQTHQDNHAATDPNALEHVLTAPRHETWTGVLFAPRESFEWLDLWLACRMPNPLMRMEVKPAAKTSGLVSPMFPTVAMATTRTDGTLAYLTIRPADPALDGSNRYEVGVIAHGPTGRHLAEHMSQEIITWDASFRTRTVTFAIPDTTPEAQPDQGHFVLHRPHTPMTVTWQ